MIEKSDVELLLADTLRRIVGNWESPSFAGLPSDPNLKEAIEDEAKRLEGAHDVGEIVL